ncbi:sugar transferase [Palleronia abyssalis]|uniref:UDP-N-acetylgalactosamine-undecaprenyl-phosphate N-acetylgalactosaminephosphotransferase n=1 Tax=Palleronia abyssalis TaxID=1501240 RepID=A0A2R8BZG6_9RHOB|nr:sugar transferase [Palleronia abyssalis]SPJ25542.1 UDP-N-acetylgalactosamine-undecaprenyl-phosphate N-acetylgalactosaminephosphotransferase [Palleronia abyssalis]
MSLIELEEYEADPNSGLRGDNYPDDSIRARSRQPVGGVAKRSLDLAICLVLIPLFLPLFVGLCLLVKLTDPGPIFFGHKRVGFEGRTFKCWKFRTMVTNGDELLRKHFAAHPHDLAIWMAERKLPQDPRVTVIGVVLRKLSLDEIPQIINVINGEMSLVGPRPVVKDELDNYARSTGYYLKARPGVTGAWQVSGRSDTSYRDRVKLDRYYISNWTLVLDFWILVRTLPAVLKARGAR